MDVSCCIGEKMPREFRYKLLWPYQTDTKIEINIARKNKETFCISGRHTFIYLRKFEAWKMKQR
jgi:hypothetical protein